MNKPFTIALFMFTAIAGMAMEVDRVRERRAPVVNLQKLIDSRALGKIMPCRFRYRADVCQVRAALTYLESRLDGYSGTPTVAGWIEHDYEPF